MNFITHMIRRFGRMINSYDPDEVSQRSFNEVTDLDVLRYNPIARHTYIASSRYEDKCNSQYSGILNTLSNHCLGTIPLPVALSDSEPLNDAIEDRWYEWGQLNGIGSALREARRKAAQTGIAILIPYASNTDYDLRLSYRVVGAECLRTPRSVSNLSTDPFTDKVTGQYVEGVEFYPNGDIKRVWINEEHKMDPTPYTVGDRGRVPGAIVWYKRSRPFPMMPECLPAFEIIPSMSRFMKNVMREAELKSAIPMAVKLDWTTYGGNKQAPPKGAFKYEPGMIPTLPPGTDLVGVAMQSMTEDRARLSDKFCSVAARCIDMPKNLAILDSSDSNMATSHIDLQPWKYVVDIDRYDFEVVVRRVYRHWYSMASLTTLLPPVSYETVPPPTLFNYTVLFNHPDPMKCASARATDLGSGATTLSIQYSEQSKNARREIEKECRLFGVTKEKYLEVLLASRSKQALEIMNGSKDDQDADQDGQERSRSKTV